RQDRQGVDGGFPRRSGSVAEGGTAINPNDSPPGTQMTQMHDNNHLLDTFQKGAPIAGEKLFVAVYSELRRLATAKMSREAPGQTLQPTALVHGAWLCLGGERAT